jgi:hypothetical protein
MSTNEKLAEQTTLVSRYAETEESVRRDADPNHLACKGLGWHGGWDQDGLPVRLRCPCVDQRRTERAKAT